MFPFQHTAELLFAAQYLAQFDDTIKFKLVQESRRATLQMSTVNVPPFSFTTIDFVDDPKQPEKVALIEPQTTSWAVNTTFFANVLSCYDQQRPLTIEVASDLSCMFLYQRRSDEDNSVQVAQIAVLHDLGPRLLVDHDVGRLYTVADLRSFADVVRSVCTSDDDRCSVSLQRLSATESELVLQTSTVTSSLKLSFEDAKNTVDATEGSARCDDLREFARLCTRLSKTAQTTTLMLGFGTEGIALFRLDWAMDGGPRTTNLFFCAA